MEAREEALDLRKHLQIIKKRLVLILSITLIATIISGLASFYLLKPIYQAETEILVSKEVSQDTINNQEIQANINLVNTYSEIIKSLRILDIVGRELGLGEKEIAALERMITVKSVKNSQVISIIVENPSQQQAVKIANTIANTFKTEIVNLMKINNVQVLTVAKEKANADPVSPNVPLNIAVTFIVSLLASVAIAFLLDFLDNTLKTENDIEKELGLPVLGSVPQITESKGKNKKRRTRPYEVTAIRERRA